MKDKKLERMVHIAAENHTWQRMPDPEGRLRPGDDAIYTFPDGDWLCRVIFREPDGRAVQVRKLRPYEDPDEADA